MQEYKVTVDSQGTVRWRDFKTDLPHRVDGPAVEYDNGDKYWFVKGKLHREDGPAVEHPDGYKEWYIDGKYHRIDGPAIEYADGDKSWYLDGVKYTENQFNAKMNSSSCEGREIKIDGQTYLIELKE